MSIRTAARFNLCDGITRLADCADNIQRVEIDLASEPSNVFFAGHRLRLDVTSISFPRRDLSLDTDDRDDSHREVAHQRLHHDAYHPSSLELPIVT